MSNKTDTKVVKQHVWNPTLELVGYVLTETKHTIRNRDKRIGKVAGKLDVIHVDERVNVYRDNSKFVKIFIDSGALLEYNELTRGGQRLLATIIERLEYNSDCFYYTASVYAKEANLDEKNISMYINELIENEWIFKSTEKGKFWINLCYICIGDRDELYRKYRQAVK